MASLITTEKLSKTFSRKGSQHHVLKNIDLEIDGDDFTVVMGPSGAGKSTLLYAIIVKKPSRANSYWMPDADRPSEKQVPTLPKPVSDGLSKSGISFIIRRFPIQKAV